MTQSKKPKLRKKSHLGGGLASQRRGQLGVNVVERVVLRDWASRWQPLDAHNDDGIDGLIFLEKGGAATGQVIYVQIKCYQRPSKSGDVNVSIGRTKLAKAIKKWRKLVGAAILIHVDPDTLEARWVNLHADGDLLSASVRVPASQLFNADAKTVIGELCGTLHRDVTAKNVDTYADDFPHLRSKEHIQTAARKFYRELASRPIEIGETGQQVKFTREGWRHITRRGRPQLTRFQSLVLLGAIRPILQVSSTLDIRLQPTPHEPDNEKYFAIKAAVSFPHRQSGIIKIVLHRNDADKPGQYRFHTIYEPRRTLSLRGVRKRLAQ